MINTKVMHYKIFGYDKIKLLELGGGEYYKVIVEDLTTGKKRDLSPSWPSYMQAWLSYEKEIRKAELSQKESGKRTPLSASPTTISIFQVKNYHIMLMGWANKDGYAEYRVGYGPENGKNLTLTEIVTSLEEGQQLLTKTAQEVKEFLK